MGGGAEGKTQETVEYLSNGQYMKTLIWIEGNSQAVRLVLVAREICVLACLALSKQIINSLIKVDYEASRDEEVGG